MDTNELAAKIATRVIADTSFWVGVIGLVGAVIGAAIAVIGNLVLFWMQDSGRRDLDNGRKKLLKKMLLDPRFPDGWRKLSTLSRVVGADDETTRRLLIEINARGSERDDDMWGLVERHPLSKCNQ